MQPSGVILDQFEICPYYQTYPEQAFRTVRAV